MRIVRALLIVLVLFSAVFFGMLVHSRAWGKHFARIAPGMSESSVAQQAGTPTREASCQVLPEPPDACTRVLVYAGPLSAIVPEFWLIVLDREHRVVRVVHTTRAA